MKFELFFYSYFTCGKLHVKNMCLLLFGPLKSQKLGKYVLKYCASYYITLQKFLRKLKRHKYRNELAYVSYLNTSKVGYCLVKGVTAFDPHASNSVTKLIMSY